MVKELVKNDKQYWEFVRNLRNHPSVKTGFIEQEYIDMFDHALYMQRLGSSFYICLVDGEPAGYVGVIKSDIRVATHPNFQKMGVASFMINELMRKHPNSYAKVKVDNEASVGLFEKCGFVKKYYILEKQ
jgi:ribosomal protein S18 acetylase RimI-like enzyme